MKRDVSADRHEPWGGDARAQQRDPATRSRPSAAGNVALRNRRGRRECRVMASPMARLQQKTQAAATTG